MLSSKLSRYQRPVFEPHWRVESIPGEGIVLLSETRSVVFPGAAYALAAPLMDGRRSAAEIVEALAGQAEPDAVRKALAELEREDCLTEGADETPAGEAAWWAVQGVDADTARRRLAAAAVSVAAVPGLSPEPLLAALEAAGVRVSPDAERQVVLTDDYLRPELADYNRQALETGRPWLLVKPVGCVIWLGPLFCPEQTGCWECLAQRLRPNREVEHFLQQRTNSTRPFFLPAPSTAASREIAWGMAASSVAAWIARDEAPELQGTLRTLDTRSWTTEKHTLIWRPQCPACGDPPEPEELTPRPLALRSRQKTFTADGGHRVRTPEATIERYEQHISPITGAVTQLVRQGGPRSSVLNAYAAGLNLARVPHDLASLRRVGRSLRSTTGGKGTTDVQARASALCEALERYSGNYRGEEPRRRATFRELGEAAIHPNICMQFSKLQYRERDARNASGGHHSRVPLPFDEDAVMSWTPAWSLTRNEPRYLPTTFCFYEYPVWQESAHCITCSNGNAAGNTVEEAILQGFLELVERDCIAMWWYNRARRPAVSLNSFDEPYLQTVQHFLAERNWEMAVLDITNDLDIPAFVALARQRGGGAEMITQGYGAHFDPRLALLRAVTEMNQLLAVLWFGVGSDPGARVEDQDPQVREWMMTATVADQPHLAPDPSQRVRQASEYPRKWSEDLLEDVRFCQSLVEQRGMEMMVLDQTRPDIGLPVVKVIVPGMRHFWPRFAPGRLYDVPVQLGWIPEPTPEEQLNPIAIFT